MLKHCLKVRIAMLSTKHLLNVSTPNKPRLWLWSIYLFCYPMLGAFIYFGGTRVQCLKLVRNIVRNYNNCKSSVLVSNQIPT